MKKLLFLFLLMLSGLLVASNMGFKLTKTLVYVDANHVNVNWISLPYYYLTGTVNAENVCDDIGGTCNTLGNCEVAKWNVSTDTYSTWTCQTAKGTPFTVNPGEGIYVKPNTNQDFIIVGSHNPTLQLTLTYVDANHVNVNWISVPYHTTAANAENLCDEIGGVCNTLGNCEVGKWNVSTDTYSTWTCQTAKGTPFTLTPGEAVYVKPNATITGYIPSHY